MADHLIDEVDAALRQDRMEHFWRQFGQLLVAGSIGILLLTIGAVIWQNHEGSTRQAWTSRMLVAQAAIEKNELDKAQDALREAEKTADDSLLPLTRLWQAQVLLKAKKEEEALTVVKKMSGEDAYRDFGRLILRASGKDADGKIPETFRFTAQEMDAARKLAAGDKDEARKLLSSLAEDALASSSMRERARLLLSGLPAPAEQPGTTPAPSTTKGE